MTYIPIAAACATLTYKHTGAPLVSKKPNTNDVLLLSWKMAGTMLKVGGTASLRRSFCSLMPISITLVACSSAFTLPSARAAGSSGGRGTQAGQRSSPSSDRRLSTQYRASPALSTRGGAEEERPAQGRCGDDKHSFRSTVRKFSHARVGKPQGGRCASPDHQRLCCRDIALQPQAS